MTKTSSKAHRTRRKKPKPSLVSCTPENVSPELTGGAGFTFEDRVIASYLALLLTRASTVRGLADHTATFIAQQQAANDEPLDDFIVDAIALDGESARLSLQVKREIIISDAKSNTDFRDAVINSWRTIRKSKFKEGQDRVGIAVGTVADGPKRALETVCEWARSSQTLDSFNSRFSSLKSSNPNRRALETIRSILKGAAADDAGAAVYKLLQHFVLMRFDFMHEGAEGPTIAIDALQHCLVPTEASRASDLWSRLCNIAREGAGKKAEYTRASLLSELRGGFKFSAAAYLRADVDKIAAETASALASINSDIDGIHLSRSSILSDIEAKAGSARFVQIVGLAGSGKSVVLAELARRKCEIGATLFIKSDRLRASSWSQHASNLGISSSGIEVLLAELLAVGSGVLFIDGLDRTEVAHRNVVADLINEILKKPTLAGWKIITSMRDSGIEPLRDWLPRELVVSGTIATVEVGNLDDADAEALVQERPNLRPIVFGSSELREIGRRPFFIATLAKDNALRGQTNYPSSEVELLDAWWRRGGYSSEQALLIRRQNALVELAKAGASDFGRRMSISAFDAEAIASLRSDGIVKDLQPGHTIAFAHDIFFEWAFTQLLIRLDDSWITGLLEAGEPPILGRAVELLSQLSLQVDGKWAANLVRLEGSRLRSQWKRAWLLGPLTSSQFTRHISQIEPVIFADSKARFRELIVWYQAEKTRPNPLVLEGALGPQGASREQTIRLADQFAWPSDFASWRRLLGWVFKKKDDIPVKLVADVVSIFDVWQNAAGNIKNAISDRVISVSNDWLKEVEDVRHPEEFPFNRGRWDDVPSKQLDDLESRLRTLVLRSVRSNPDDVAAYLKRLETSPRVRHAAFDDVVVFAPLLAAHVPEQLTQLALEELLKELPLDHARRMRDEERRSPMMTLGSDSSLDFEWRRLAVEDHHSIFSPTSPLAEPFHSLLKLSPQNGLVLIRKIVNHAMTAWRQLHEMRPRKFGTPLPVILEFPWGRQTFWGDGNVYRWYRGILGPQGVECALMALEGWALSRLDAGDDLDAILRDVLQDNECCSVLGVALALCLEGRHVSATSLPIIVSQHLWHWDIHRSIEDKSGLHANTIGLGMPGTNLERGQATIETNKRRCRRWEVRDLVVPTIFSSDPSIASKAQEAIQAFPSNLPFRTVEESESENCLEELRRRAEIWAHTGKPETYASSPTEDGKHTLIYHNSPVAEDPDVKRAQTRLVKLNDELGLVQWARKSIEKNAVCDTHTLEDAISQAKTLDTDHLFITRAAIGHDDYHRSAAVAGAAAAALVVAADLTPSDNLWAKEVVARASALSDATDEHFYHLSINPDHPCSFAAHGLGKVIVTDPNDSDSRHRLLGLITHPSYDVAENALKASFGCAAVNADFAWQALVVGMRLVITPRYSRGVPEEDRITSASRRGELAKEIFDGKRFDTLPELPPAWVFEEEPLTGDEFYDRRRSQGKVWRDADEFVDCEFAIRVLKHVPIATFLSKAYRVRFLALIEGLITWTLDRNSPKWRQDKESRRDEASTELGQWDSDLFHWLASVGAHLSIEEVRKIVLKPIFDLDDGRFLHFVTPFCSSHVCQRVYDAPVIEDGVLALIEDCRDRLLQCRLWERARWNDGDLYGFSVPYLIKSLLFDFHGQASGAARFANGNWSEVELLVPIVEPLVKQVGDIPLVTASFLNLVEKGIARYPATAFVEQLKEILSKSEGTPAGWYSSSFIGRFATALQLIAERDYPVATGLQQQMLVLLDKLVDLGDRRAAALQISELFRHTRAA